MIRMKVSKKIALIDDDYLEIISQYKWHAHYNGRRWYVRGSRYVNKIRIRIYLHNLIMPKIEGLEIDHINRNTLDNRKQNLRHLTRQERVVIL